MFSKRAIIICAAIAVVVGIGIGASFRGCGQDAGIGSINAVVSETVIWTCSMHPQIKQGNPGKCPICGMDLVSLKEDSGGERAVLKLGERARQLASVKTEPVVYRELTKSIYTVGKINYDESRVEHVTSWMAGRIDKLYVDFTGTMVQKGEHLVYIYSPELVSSQEEYLIAYSGIKDMGDDNVFESSATAKSLLKNSRDRLLLLGVTENQINELEKTQKADSHLTIYAPVGGTVIHKNVFEGMYVKTGDRLFTISDLNRVWLYLDIYEYDLPWIRYGQDVEVTTESYPGATFHGTVVFIDPFLDEVARTIRVRVNMDNNEGELKPGMYANAVIKVRFGADGVILDSDIEGKYICPMHPDIVSDDPDKCPECGMKLALVGSRPMVGRGYAIPGIGKQDTLNHNGHAHQRLPYRGDTVHAKYTCPMHPEVVSDKPADCPECGMHLEMVEQSRATKKYTCPMHPEVVSDKPADCPECGMHLEMVEQSRATKKYTCPMHPEIVSDKPADCPECGMHLEMVAQVETKHINKDEKPDGVLSIPHSAVLYTGLRNIVYVENEPGSYESREVRLGPKADGYYHVISGLEPGERVVSSGNFLIDSQMQLLGKPSLMFPEGSSFENDGNHAHSH